MSITAMCPSCARKFAAPAEAAGRTVRCPICRTPMTVPGRAPLADQATIPDTPARRANPFGIASFGIGVLALLICWLPVIGLASWPLAGLGLLLGIVGIVSASRNPAQRATLAISGLVVGALAIAVSGAMTVVVGRVIAQAAREMKVEEDAAGRESAGGDKPAGAGGETLVGLDRNHDGRLSADEVPDRFRPEFGRIDLDDDGFASEGEWIQALVRAGITAPTRGPVMATSLLTSADDFVVDVYHNGERVPLDRRQVVGETYGATAEKVNIEVHEGDWVVFNVVNNRLRWDGACYFGAAGLNESEPRVGFVSEATSGRWSVCDDPGRAPLFIAEANYLADRPVKAPENPWGGGPGEMTARVPGWHGTGIWGSDRRNVWIKFNARPASEDAPAPKPEAAAPAPSPAP